MNALYCQIQMCEPRGVRGCPVEIHGICEARARGAPEGVLGIVEVSSLLVVLLKIG